MNHMPLLQHLKTLKAAMPQANKQIKVESKLPIFKNIKEITKKSGQLNHGIFFNLSFCIPYIDPLHDPTPEKLTEMVRGIFMQGGLIIEFSKKMNQQHVKFVIISQRSSVSEIRRQISGFLKFDKILKYQFVLDSLKRLKLMDPNKYLLFHNQIYRMNDSDKSELAKQRLSAEKIQEHLMRPKLPDPPEQQKTIQGKQAEQLKEGHSQQNKPQTRHQFIQGVLEQKGYAQTKANKQTLEWQSQLKLKESNTSNNQVTQTSAPIIKTHAVSPFHKQPLNSKSRTIRTQERPINQPKRVSQTQRKQEKKQVREQPPQYKWQKKSDRRVVWFQPPKNLSSHNFKSNNFICDKFMELQQIYKRNNDIRSFSYVRAVATIKSHQKQIKTAEDLKQIKGLSAAMIEKAKQLLETGSINKLMKYSRKEENIVCKELQQVWGIGPKKAKQFYDIGIKTVEDLKKRPQLISKNMSVGLKYFQQFKNRIPRQKITRIYEILKKNFYSLVLSDKTHFIEIVGSYRRQKQTCGDIDVLISRRDGSVQTNLLKNFIKSLEDVGFLTETLSQPRAYDGKNHTAFMGVCFFQQKHHRIDIKQYPIEQYPFALMYFTGSDLFNRQMRMRAHNKGLLLSDHGLRAKQRNGFNKIWKGGQMPVFRTEQQIFRFLQFDYCRPSQRSI